MVTYKTNIKAQFSITNNHNPNIKCFDNSCLATDYVKYGKLLQNRSALQSTIVLKDLILARPATLNERASRNVKCTRPCYNYSIRQFSYPCTDLSSTHWTCVTILSWTDTGSTIWVNGLVPQALVMCGQSYRSLSTLPIVDHSSAIS